MVYAGLSTTSRMHVPCDLHTINQSTVMLWRWRIWNFCSPNRGWRRHASFKHLLIVPRLPQTSLLATIKRHKLLNILCATRAQSDKTLHHMEHKVLPQINGHDYGLLCAYFTVIARVHQLAKMDDANRATIVNGHRMLLLKMIDAKLGAIPLHCIRGHLFVEINYKRCLNSTNEQEYMDAVCANIGHANFILHSTLMSEYPVFVSQQFI
jgi:hypothetical protein